MNPFAIPYACSKCRDTRMLSRSVRFGKDDLERCGACGNYSEDEYERFRTAAWLKSHKTPEICELDLTDEEFKVFGLMRENNPKASKMTVLMWMEGQRYKPADDPVFLTEAREAFKVWRAR